jgi:hypothetical protein
MLQLSFTVDGYVEGAGTPGDCKQGAIFKDEKNVPGAAAHNLQAPYQSPRHIALISAAKTILPFTPY